MFGVIKFREEGDPDDQSNQDFVLPSARNMIKDTNLLDLGRQLLSQAKLGNGEEVKLLVAAGAPFTADWVGTSPIHWTSYYNYIDVTELLLRSGISPDARNKVDRTPLHVACQKGHIDIVRLLLAFGADVNARDMIRMSPLHWSAVSGNTEIVKLLLDHGAAMQPVSKFGKTPADIAEDHSYYDIIKLIEETKAVPPQERLVRVALKRKQSSMLGQKMKLEEKGTNQSTGEILKMVSKRRKIGIIVSKTGENGNNKIELLENNGKPKNNSPTNGLTKNTQQAIQMLKEHGITMLEPDNGTVVSSAVQGGQSMKLTEAGRLALSSSKPDNNITSMASVKAATSALTIPTTSVVSPTDSKNISSAAPLMKVATPIISSKSPVKLLPNGQKIITIKADQLINMTKEKKVIIKQARPVPNARIFDGKLYTTAQKDELLMKVKEKCQETSVSLAEKKNIFEEAKKAFEEARDRALKIKKEVDELQKQMTSYEQILKKLEQKNE